MKFREHLLQLDPKLITEGEEIELSYDALYLEIHSILQTLSDDEVDEFGAFLSVEFFDATEEDIDGVYFDIENVEEMIIELGEESYEMILDLLLPEDFNSSDDSEYIEFLDTYYDSEEDLEDLEDLEDEDMSEGVGRIMKIKKLNKKKRKFFTKSAATLRKERAKRVRKNRETRATRKAYRRVNKAKLKAYQKSRGTFIKKGRHFKKIRRKAGE